MHDSLEFYAMYRSRLDHVGNSRAKAPVAVGERSDMGVRRAFGKALIASGRVLVEFGLRWVGYNGAPHDRHPRDTKAIVGRGLETYG